MKLISAFVAIWFFLLSQAAPAQKSTLLAWYPLNTTPNDSTRHFGPMVLENTPFQKRTGIYCNGMYNDGDTPNWCEAATPVLPPSIFKAFSISVKFKVDSITPPRRDRDYVIVGGSGWRWIGIALNSDSTIALMYNGGQIETSSVRFSANTWHEAAVTYDSSASTASLYLDGTLACSAHCIIDHGPDDYDRAFSITNYSVGLTFKGYIKDLKIYSTARLPRTLK